VRVQCASAGRMAACIANMTAAHYQIDARTA
jgi:hypothetical protein